MNKTFSIGFLVIIFIALLFGSFAMINERGTGTSTSQVVETENRASVVLSEPESQSVISSPVTVTGEARGNWFFEASFPIEVIDGNGTVLGVGIAQAQGEWMTTDYVPFSTTISFSQPATPNGFILLKKDNPSGLPEHDATIAVPITFAQ